LPAHTTLRTFVVSGIAAALVAFAAAPSGAGTTSGIVDRTLGTSGTVLSPTTPLISSHAATRDAKGRVVIVSTAPGTTDEIFVWRYLADGQLDQSFGVGGTARLHVQGLIDAPAVAAYPDGRAVVLIRSIPGTLIVARFLATGRLDPSFGLSGITAPTGGDGTAIAVDHAGRVLVTSTVQDRAGVLRYTTGGAPDSTFGFVGRVNVLPPNGFVTDIAVDANDGVFAVGVAAPPGGRNTGRIDHVTNRGQRDQHFGTNGELSIPELLQLNRVVVATNGDVVAVGADPARLPNFQVGVVRLRSTGARVTTFGTNGVMRVPSAWPMFPSAFALAPDGSMMIAGQSPAIVENTPDGPLYAALLRLLPNGHVDTAFGCGGMTWMRFGLAASANWEAPIAVFLDAHDATVVGEAQSLTGAFRAALQRVRWTPAPEPAGYWLATSDGAVDAFGRAAPCSSLGYAGERAVGLAGTPSGRGYWQVTANGGVFSFGDAQFYGSAGNLALHAPIVGAAATPTRHGYWLLASDGGVFSYGDAHFYGSTGGLRLNKPVVGMQPTPTGHGYWLVATDGGVFSYGDARFFGSTGGIRLNQPVVGMTASRSGRGYWLIASDGGIFSYGDAHFYGSTGALRLNRPVVGGASTPSGRGYWLVASDGGIFSFGDAPFLGSDANVASNGPFIGMAAAG
jgi:uncharacterized delta-60 repeat protein